MQSVTPVREVTPATTPQSSSVHRSTYFPIEEPLARLLPQHVEAAGVQAGVQGDNRACWKLQSYASHLTSSLALRSNFHIAVPDSCSKLLLELLGINVDSPQSCFASRAARQAAGIATGHHTCNTLKQRTQQVGICPMTRHAMVHKCFLFSRPVAPPRSFLP